MQFLRHLFHAAVYFPKPEWSRGNQWTTNSVPSSWDSLSPRYPILVGTTNPTKRGYVISTAAPALKHTKRSKWKPEGVNREHAGVMEARNLSPSPPRSPLCMSDSPIPDQKTPNSMGSSSGSSRFRRPERNDRRRRSTLSFNTFRSGGVC